MQTSNSPITLRIAVWLAFALTSVAHAQGGEDSSIEARLKALEKALAELAANPDAGGGGVDLSEEISNSLEYDNSHVLSKPWYENIHISGFGAGGYLDSGNAGTRPNGGFQVKETSLFVEADAWENTSFFFELQVNRLAKDDSLFLRTGEVYAHFRDLFGPNHGVKLGRVDIPFGEEYLWQDSPDNPLITQSAPYPYGYDEGIVVYGKYRSGLGWIASLTDGTDSRSVEDDPAKAVTAKVYGNVTEKLYLSGSAMTNGRAAKSAFEFGGSHFEPVGAGGANSTVGASPNTKVNSQLFQGDAIYSVCDDLELSLFYGRGSVEDEAAAFDRDLMWFMIQPVYQITPTVYGAIRFSEIGADDGMGYHFDGKIIAGGNGAFGYDAKRLRRISGGLGWKPSPNVLFKVEIGQDRFDLIGASPLAANNNDRKYFGFEVVLSF